MTFTESKLNFQDEKSIWFNRKLQHFYEFTKFALTPNEKYKNDRYNVFVHYPKYNENNESGENFTKENFEALKDGIDEWENAIPGIFITPVEYDTGTIFDRIEILRKTCSKPECKFLNEN